MRLIAICERRTDNTVILLGADRNEYTFRTDAGGDLVCDIEDAETIELALHSGNFCPAEGEEDAADKLLGGEDKPRKRGRPPKAKAVEPKAADGEPEDGEG